MGFSHMGEASPDSAEQPQIEKHSLAFFVFHILMNWLPQLYLSQEDHSEVRSSAVGITGWEPEFCKGSSLTGKKKRYCNSFLNNLSKKTKQRY